MLPPRFVAPLFDGPIDIVGDVHGEIDALNDLLRVLGYDEDGNHRAGRRLVFVGDLIDRGPDSVGVVLKVARLVQAGRAQCILGNHELNALRETPKEGNGWFLPKNHDHVQGKFQNSRAASDDHRAQLREFFDALPLALERPDLRVVHACWHAPSIDALRRAAAAGIVPAFQRFAEESRHRLEATGMMEQYERERHDHARALFDPDAKVPFLPGIAAIDESKQMANPVRLVTSGIERQAGEPFFAGGKWRMVERVLWWDEYADGVPVIFGHYWRQPAAGARAGSGKGGADLFAGKSCSQWLGPDENAFCVDFSVGRRYVERERGLAVGSGTRLAAVRWPDRELVFEDGTTVALG
jgi:hypothetical protein